MKRAAIYFFYDKDGIVDSYHECLIGDMAKNADYFLVVVNGFLIDQGFNNVKHLLDEVLVRENKGYDAYAYRYALEYIGWEEIKKYDEIVLFNFTIFGPVYPFSEMFERMDKEKADFWGITKHHGYKEDAYHKCKYGYIPEHIQSNFIVIRNRLLSEDSFREYWENIPLIKDYTDAICLHEAVFTKHFNDLGFQSKVYVDTDDLKDHSPYPLMNYPKELISKRKCPIFKRKTFFNYYDEWFDVSVGNAGIELMKYLKENELYPMEHIWENILRTANMHDIKERLHLNYILSNETLDTMKEDGTNRKSIVKLALFMHIYFTDQIDYCKKYAENMPAKSDIIITTDSIHKKEKIEKMFQFQDKRSVKVIRIENRGRDVSSLLIGLKDFVKSYDYVCFVHDKKAEQSWPYSIGEGFSYLCFENTLSSKVYVENIINQFNNDPFLGMLVPPPPHHGPYFRTIGDEWVDNYEAVREYAKKWGITVDIREDKPAVAPYGTCFWFRTKAMEIAFELGLRYSDFPKEPTGENDGNFMHVIERMYPYFVQQSGYYTGCVMTNEYAKLEVTNLTHLVRGYQTALFKKYGVMERHVLEQCISNNRNMGFKIRVRNLIGQSNYVALWKTKEKIVRRFKK